MVPASDCCTGVAVQILCPLDQSCILILAFLAQVPLFLGLFIWGIAKRTFSGVSSLRVVRKKGKSEGTFLYS